MAVYLMQFASEADLHAAYKAVKFREMRFKVDLATLVMRVETGESRADLVKYIQSAGQVNPVAVKELTP